MEKKFNFVYVTICLENWKMYIGEHKTDDMINLSKICKFELTPQLSTTKERIKNIISGFTSNRPYYSDIVVNLIPDSEFDRYRR